MAQILKPMLMEPTWIIGLKQAMCATALLECRLEITLAHTRSKCTLMDFVSITMHARPDRLCGITIVGLHRATGGLTTVLEQRLQTHLVVEILELLPLGLQGAKQVPEHVRLALVPKRGIMAVTANLTLV